MGVLSICWASNTMLPWGEMTPSNKGCVFASKMLYTSHRSRAVAGGL